MREGNFVVESAYIDEGRVQYCTEFVDRMVRFNETERTAKYLNSVDNVKTIDGVYHIYEETVDGGVRVYLSTGRPYLSDNGLKLIWEDECDCENCNGCDEMDGYFQKALDDICDQVSSILNCTPSIDSVIENTKLIDETERQISEFKEVFGMSDSDFEDAVRNNMK